MCLPMELRGGNEFARQISDSASDTIEAGRMEVDEPIEVLLEVLADVMSSLSDEWISDDGVHLAKMLAEKMEAEWWNDEDEAELLH